MRGKTRRIDVHYHIVPKPCVEALGRRRISGSPYVRFLRWTPDPALRHLGRATGRNSGADPTRAVRYDTAAFPDPVTPAALRRLAGPEGTATGTNCPWSHLSTPGARRAPMVVRRVAP